MKPVLFYFISVTFGIAQVSISSTFYEQLLREKIPKEQKKTVSLTVFFTLLESAPVKAVLKMLMKSTPDRRGPAHDYFNPQMLSLCLPSGQKIKKSR